MLRLRLCPAYEVIVGTTPLRARSDERFKSKLARSKWRCFAVGGRMKVFSEVTNNVWLRLAGRRTRRI